MESGGNLGGVVLGPLLKMIFPLTRNVLKSLGKIVLIAL